jgi:hypothetical protein
MVTAPSEDPLTAWITAPRVNGTDTNVLAHVIPFRCSADLQFTGPLDVTMTASEDVKLHDVVFRLVNESETGTPVESASTAAPGSEWTNTFDEDDIRSAFGSIQIPGGTAKTYRFRTNLTCPRSVPEAVAASIRFVEFSGKKNTITVTAPFETEFLSDGRAVRAP